jgi:Mn2+/Fe2+ NRAMP family transporter
MDRLLLPESSTLCAALPEFFSVAANPATDYIALMSSPNKVSSPDTFTEKSATNLLRAIGPGILYAAAAVGVSHLVQATRAGAVYGFSLTLIIVFACIIKYPGLRFGTDYAVATETSLIASYIKQGKITTVVYLLNLIFTFLFVPAAIVLVSSGLIKAVLNIETSDTVLAILVFASCAVILIIGHYSFLERITKVLVALFTVLIVLAVLVVLGNFQWTLSQFAPPVFDRTTLIFVVAITGFMPSPMTAGVMGSLWLCAKADNSGKMPSWREAKFDFDLGFITTLVLAFGFMLLGAGIMHGAGAEFAPSSGAFAHQLIELFTETIGDWSFWVIGIAAIAVMYSSALTVIDGNARFIQISLDHFLPDIHEKLGISRSRIFDLSVVIICLGGVIVLTLLLQSFRAFIDLVSVITAIVAPMLALMNHRAVHSDEVPLSSRPTPLMYVWSVAGILVMSIVSMLYLYFRFFT